MTTPTSQQRDTIKKISPPWLASGNAEKLLYTAGLALDSLLEKMNQAMKAHVPGYGDASALPYLGLDRVLTQGPTEPNANFIARLKTSFDAWQRAGSSRAVLEQITAYLQSQTSVANAAMLPTSAIVGGNSTTTIWDTIYNTMAVGAAPFHALISPVNWNWDGVYLPWRNWLVLFFSLSATGQAGTAASFASASGAFVTVTGLSGMTAANVQQYLTVSNASSSGNNGTFQITSFVNATSVVVAAPANAGADAHNGALVWSVGNYPIVGPGPVWGATTGALWGDTTRSWGLNVPSTSIGAVRALLALWKRADAYFPWMIVSFGGGAGGSGAEFSPYSTPGSGNPDGTWGSWAKTVGGVSLAARQTTNPYDCFCDGTGIYGQASVHTQT